MQFKCARGLLHLQLFLLFVESVPLQPSSLGTSSPTCHQKPLTLDASSLLSLPLHPALLETLCLEAPIMVPTAKAPWGTHYLPLTPSQALPSQGCPG